MKRILFLTSTNLAANPRLAKELRLAIDHGYACTVVQFILGNWSDALTLQMQSEFSGVRFLNLSALRRPLLPWLMSSVFQKLVSRMPVKLLSNEMLSVAISKRALILMRAMQQVKESFTWVVAHNPATFYPAMVFCARTGANLGIDVEDYHPGETSWPKGQTMMRRLMRNILPMAKYISFASPLIAEAVREDIPKMSIRQLVIINGFPEFEFREPVPTNGSTLKLVWYSQYIDFGRGLEKVLKVVDDLYPRIELHLIGYLNSLFQERLLNGKRGVVIHPPMGQAELHRYLALFDAGLAADIPIDVNRDIALTNKIIAYAQAGLMIAAMHTRAQDRFLDESGLVHVKMKNEETAIRNALLELIEGRVRGSFDFKKQYEIGRKLSWERISAPLLEVWGN